ncbi:fibronectin type III domain-containing protein [Conexibacter sp. JD483]|uniref:fibronectin type III domain-containing protein n=1 Tax=unclassified Conexibacter TaxID=2627773 RepID=UPI002723CB8D|nr:MULTISPECIES: fibronectin type III domain-containing protein [unclassified Conexibacter]MDO8189210.1 fibronectin type III domain-containing protein [Conexibacter sp. CPCC 205706]MDO8201350.1 fibronectin type III domain-containing protein [Conexibacter sp. CPCC 205762]MDR9372269.1 fibronectin type III domain-containing protein [Conexibacter sp. JD483]
MQRALVATVLAGAGLVAAAPATAIAASPAASTSSAADVGQTAVTLRGSVDPNSVPTTYAFQWGTTASYGSQTPNRSAGSGASGRAVTFRLRGLTPGTAYHYRIVATNSDGTTVGGDRSFRTTLPPATLPSILATAPFAPYANSVTLTATVNPGGAATTYKFQFGTTNTYGAETFAASVPAGIVPVPVKIPLNGLQERTTYHFRTVLSNRKGTVVGPDAVFTTGPFAPAQVTSQTRPSKQRRSHPYFVTTGALRLGSGVGVADGCQGIVGVRFTSGSRTVASKRVRLKSGHCSYRLRVRALPPSGKSKLRVRVHFYGNAILTPQDARSYLVGFK